MEQVRQGVLIADSLAAQYQDVLSRFVQAWKDDDDAEMSVLRAELERVYTGMWEQLDDAAAKTRAAGRATDAYAAIRRNPSLEVGAGVGNIDERVIGITHGVTKTTVKTQLTVQTNNEGLELAKAAIASLRDTWPELDWAPQPEIEADLRPRGLLSRLFRKR